MQSALADVFRETGLGVNFYCIRDAAGQCLAASCEVAGAPKLHEAKSLAESTVNGKRCSATLGVSALQDGICSSPGLV
jgi:hypothetical protein